MEKFITEFERYFVIRGKSQATIRKYLKDLRQFFRECRIMKVESIARESLEAWLLKLRTRGCSTGTLANHLWAIKAFLEFLKNEKRISFYEFDVSIPYVDPPQFIEFLEIEELERIFSIIDLGNIHGLRLRTFIEVMINTGLRPSEALALKKSDITGEELEIVGKGKKKRIIYFNERAKEWISRYLTVRNDDLPSLFISHCRPKPLSLRTIEQAFKNLIKKAGITRHVTLHDLRHTYSTTLLSNGCPSEYVALLLGHSNPEVTRRHYLSIQRKHAKVAHFRFLSYDRQTSYPQTPLDKPFRHSLSWGYDNQPSQTPSDTQRTLPHLPRDGTSR